MRRTTFPLKPVTLLVLILALAGCSIPKPLVERIKEKGELVVATRNSLAAYYEGADGPRGLEYELASRFADELGVKVHFVTPAQPGDLLPMVVRGEVDFAAAAIAVTDRLRLQVKFTPPYQQITQQLVYRGGNRRPRTIEEAAEGFLEVTAGSSQEEILKRLKQKYPSLEWYANPELDTQELLTLVWEQLIDYTIAHSNEVILFRRFHPEIRVAFDVSDPMPLSWAFPHAEDSSLYDAASAFIERLRKDGTLDQLIERYYGHVEQLNYVDTRTFRRHINSRLPELIPYFQEAAEATGIDWRLLAAIGYQESHWDPKAVSPTGVRGIMMLTRDTAAQLGVKDRNDPRQSILGGARYLRLMEKKIPERIQEPDRLWLALAGYNIGFGHLEDARILTQRAGRDPDRWAEVKRFLPLLSQEEYYSTVKRGFARGREPVTYVDNIRSYYELLLWDQEQRQRAQATPEPEPRPLPPAPAAL